MGKFGSLSHLRWMNSNWRSTSATKLSGCSLGVALSFLYWSWRRLLELVVLRFRSEREFHGLAGEARGRVCRRDAHTEPARKRDNSDALQTSLRRTGGPGNQIKLPCPSGQSVPGSPSAGR